MIQPMVRHYPERYRVYVDSADGKPVLFEQADTLAEMIAQLAVYSPDVLRFLPDIVHEHPWRLLWHYRITVVRRIRLREVGLV